MLTRVFTQDWMRGVWTIIFGGDLTISAHPLIRQTVQKCLAGGPTAIVVDLRAVTADRDLLLRVLPTERRRADLDGVPLIYAADETVVRLVLGCGLRRFVEVYPSLVQAQQRAVQVRSRPWLWLRLPPDPLSASVARHQLGDACVAWGIAQMLYPARVVVSELVSNAVEHAGTDIEVTATVLGGYLRIRIRDGSRQRPVLGEPKLRSRHAPLDMRGLGLRLVNRHASGWGVTDIGDGKVVWAALRIRPRPDIGLTRHGRDQAP